MDAHINHFATFSLNIKKHKAKIEGAEVRIIELRKKQQDNTFN